MEKIGKNSYINIYHDLLTLQIRKSFWASIFGLVLFVTFFIIALNATDNIFKLENGFGFFLTIGMFGLIIIMSLYNLTLIDNYEMDMKQFIVSRKKYAFGFLLKQVQIKWNSESNYLYELEYDSYKNITTVWFIAISKKTNEKRRLLKFHDMKTFEAFKVIFQNKYTDIPIGEWHD